MHPIWSQFSKGLLSEEQIELCRQHLGEQPRDENWSELQRMLIQHFKCEPEAVAECWTRASGLPRFEGQTGLQLHSPFIQSFGIDLCREHGFAVVEDGDELSFLSLHPYQRSWRNEISLQLKTRLDMAIVDSSTLNRILEKNFHLSQESDDIEELSQERLDDLQQALGQSDDLLDMANKAPVVKLVNGILFQALQQRSSDIHVQPNEDDLVVRYRIDGLLQDVMNLPKSVQDAFISRLKVMGKMDIAEKRLPQDGTTSFVAAGREVDVRISSLPSIYGERVVMRLQDKSSGIKALGDIGLSGSHLSEMNRLLQLSHGIILVTGPTGAGKTTTLYAMLDQLNQPDINIITLEDPVELSLPGVSQTQVSHKKGLDFSAGLRSIVRQDPDVIMVGEVRDLETARISIQSALTGHLVLSTLHTNDALSAITRLIDIGVDPSMINASLIGVVAQRLVRTLCSECKTVHPNPDEHLRSLGFDPAERKGKPLFLEGACENCQNKGFNGRTAIYEILVLGDEMKATLQDQPSLQELKTISRQQGFVTMADDGLEKVRLGLTTADEVFRVTQVRGF